jgi:hypothetical protein
MGAELGRSINEESIWAQEVEEDIWTWDRESKMILEKTA